MKAYSGPAKMLTRLLEESRTPLAIVLSLSMALGSFPSSVALATENDLALDTVEVVEADDTASDYQPEGEAEVDGLAVTPADDADNTSDGEGQIAEDTNEEYAEEQADELDLADDAQPATDEAVPADDQTEPETVPADEQAEPETDPDETEEGEPADEGGQDQEDPEDIDGTEDEAVPEEGGDGDEIGASVESEDADPAKDEKDPKESEGADPAKDGKDTKDPEDPERVVLTYEDDALVVTAEAEPGVLPEGATLAVHEVKPVDQESADAYGEALSALSETLRAEDRSYTTATVYDIKLLDADGVEFEPGVEVKISMSYKQALTLGDVEQVPVEGAEDETAPAADVAHLTSEGELQMMGAELTTNAEGDLEEAAFTTDSFSYYITFGSNQGSTSEPTNIGDYGWIRFQTPADPNYWGTYNPPSNPLPTIGTNDAYRRIMQVRLWTVNPNGDETSYDSDNFTQIYDNMYFWTWENQIYIEEFDLPNHEVLWTSMHTAWDDPANDTGNDSLVDTYRVRGYQSATEDSSDLNVLDVYVKPVPKEREDMRYIVRYVHADGSISDGNLRVVPQYGAPVNFAASAHQRTGEVYSGMSIISGVDAISNIDKANGSGTISFNDKVDLAKVYVYYKQAPINDGNKNTRGRYDKDENGYYTGAQNLYTEKNATPIGSGNTRDFMVNLESWYVGKPASVGMVLDASGSMAWTAGTPTPIQHTAAEWDQIFGNRNWRNSSYTSSFDYKELSDNDVLTLQRKGILDPDRCDNSSMGYNGYHYYIYSNRASVSEFVALGYTRGRTSSLNMNVPGQYMTGSLTVYSLGDDEGYALRSRDSDGKNTGWFYVNSAGNTDNYHTVTGKSYDGISELYLNTQYNDWRSRGAGASKFYIDSQGRLCCIFSDGRKTESGADGSGNITYNTSSPVYEKRETMFTKNETLQDAVAQFGSILLGVSPTSQISMTRFSQHVANESGVFRNTSYLPLLNWTSNTADVTDALDLTSGAVGRTTRTDPSGPVTEYLYGLTGQTRTWTGVQAYMDYFQRRAANDNSKYLIIFTDGKDTNGDADDTGNWGATGNRVRTLKNQGYTIITVLMRSAAMESNGEYPKTSAFLQGLASGGKDGDPNKKLYFEAASNSSHDIVEEFREIAEHISTGLHDYTVRDYIDPRFDVVNDAGQVLTVLNEDGRFVEGVETTGEYRGYRMFTSPDGKQALLGYDATRQMFYVLWAHQNIPLTPKGSEDTVNTWSSQVHVRAKEDFLGGNDVLTNGNESDLNSVYKPKNGNLMEIDKSNPNPDQKPYKSFPYASVNPGLLDVAVGNYEDTIFLGERVTPGDLLTTMMGSYAANTNNPADERTDAAHRVADTVYDDDLMKELARNRAAKAWDTMSADEQVATGCASRDDYVAAHEGDFLSSVWYVEYLERYGQRFHSDINYFATLLKHVNLDKDGGVQPIITALKSNNSYTVTETETQVVIVGKTGTAAAGEKITILKFDGNSAKVELELPYYYLNSPTDPTQYAGRDRSNAVDPMDDRVGTIKYTWELKDYAGNVPVADTHATSGTADVNRLIELDTYKSRDEHMDVNKPIQYQFSMSYTPLTYADDGGTAHDGGDDGSNRTKALTGQTSVRLPLIRDAVGTERTETKQTTDEMGWAVIHAVDGRILIEKKILTKDWNEIKSLGLTGTMTFTLTGEKIADTQAMDGNPAVAKTNAQGEPQWNSANEVVWTQTVDLASATVAGTEGDYTYITLGTDSRYGGYWVEHLPKGNYTLTETVTGALKQTSITRADVVFDTDAATDPAGPYDSDPTHWEAQNTSGAKVAIGITPVHTHVNYQDSTLRYGADGDAAANSVKYDLTNGSTTPKNVDPALSGEAGGYAKDYLNAQLGRIRVENTLIKTSIDVEKVWDPASLAPSVPIVAQLSKNGTPVAYAELSSANGWKHTFGDLPIDGATYTVAEGTGTVSADGTLCEGWSAFSDKFELDGKRYQRVSIAYADKDGRALANGVAANTEPKAGTATITNQALTKVKVVKEWEGITPEEPIVIKLSSTGEADRYVQLGTDSWEYTWEDLPVATGRTYTVVEGTGTVANDGTCADFTPFATTGTYEFDGKTYKLKSLTYTQADGTAGTTSLPCVSPDSGEAKFVNEALTKIEVEKRWAEGSTESPIVVELKGSDNSVQYVELNQSNSYKHTFENLKVVAGLTYTVTEGQGTVSADGSSCTGWEPISGTYTVSGGSDKMKLLSLDYYADAAGETSATNLNGGVSPYGGKAVFTNGPVIAKVRLQKVESRDHNTTISGVTFDFLTGTDFASATLVRSVTTGNDGIVDLGNLVPGTYWLVEASAPDGYVLRAQDDPIKLVVDQEGVLTMSTIKADSDYPAPELSGPTEGVYTLMVPNLHLYNLPAAGGPGVYPFLLAGAFAAAYALSGVADERSKTALEPARRRRGDGHRGGDG